jgi:hydroxyacylglutathione hydrolase
MTADNAFHVKTIRVGPLETDCYVASYEAGKAVVIDPGFEAGRILRACKGTEVTHILITHGHYDHICAVDEVRSATGAKVVIHKDDLPLYSNAKEIAFSFGEDCVSLRPPDMLLEKEGGIPDIPVSFLHTPGHSPGGVVYIMGGFLFSGDTLFAGSIGRTDLPGSDNGRMKKSLEKLLKLDEGLKVYPGHGPGTSIKEEITSNPFLNGAWV